MRRVSFHRLKIATTPFVIAAVVVGVDLATKAWARADLRAPRHVVGPLWLRLSFNRGFSFSISHTMPIVATVLSLIAFLAVVLAAIFANRGLPAAGLGLVVGGGLSNLIDRLFATLHQVTDFVAVGSFPVFNLADAAVTCGVVTLIIATLLGRKILVRP